MLPPEERLVGAQLHRYIRDGLYWALHAPRQTGKTAFLKGWMREINATDTNKAFYVSLEPCRGVKDVRDAMNIINGDIAKAAKLEGYPDPAPEGGAAEFLLSDTLRSLSQIVAPKSLVMLFDDVNLLEDNPLVRFLSLLRAGFASRDAGVFPVSVALVGTHDPKNPLASSKDGVSLNPGTPFNIKADSATLSNFSRNDIARLFAQHTAETDREITPAALNYVYEQSKGQPWIVNSLFKRAVMRVLDEDSVEPVTLEHVAEARRQMIAASETHFDALREYLHDPRVRQMVQAIISGDSSQLLGLSHADTEYVFDTGLICRDSVVGITFANPIYEELAIRYLTSACHDSLPPDSWQWLSPEGDVDMDRLMREFQKFWRRHSEIWEQKSDYTEAFPHLLLMAFLQRVLNGGGRIEREYAAGRGRMDLAIEYNGKWHIVEVKIVHDYETPQFVEKEGLEQIRGYRDKIAPHTQSYLVIFDRRAKAKQLQWDDRITWRTEGDVTVAGC
jgi:hypothetical protein